MTTVDLAILGGGCSGLSLGRELARIEALGRHVPKTVILEPRLTYKDDRTWCFWSRPGSPLDKLLRYRWPAWRFGTQSEEIVQQANGWEYCGVPASSFYQDALETLRRSSRIQLQQGIQVEDYRDNGQTFLLETSGATYKAERVVDTIPPDLSVETACMFQCFSGVEVQCDTQQVRPNVAGLMDRMAVDAHGFRFEYVLPLSSTRVLVEATRFSPSPVPNDVLMHDLDRALKWVTGGTSFTIVRREHGVIPMGLGKRSAAPREGWVSAGTRGGAVRASSGYAFCRIQRWATDCAQALMQSGIPVGHPADPWGRQLMDGLFLSVLRDHPLRSPEVFMSLARHAAPEALVRFLSDEGSAADAIAVAGALPVPLFLKQLFYHVFRKRKRAL